MKLVGRAGLAWDQSCYATRDAWERVSRNHRRGDRTDMDAAIRDSCGELAPLSYGDNQALHGCPLSPAIPKVRKSQFSDPLLNLSRNCFRLKIHSTSSSDG
jgi:hypothetical protein